MFIVFGQCTCTLFGKHIYYNTIMYACAHLKIIIGKYYLNNVYTYLKSIYTYKIYIMNII